MKTTLNRLRAYLTKHIWADFLFVFTVYFLLQYISNQGGANSKSLIYTTVSSLVFTICMVPIFRMLRPSEKSHNLYDMVDSVRHFEVGQFKALETYLLSQGYTLDHVEGGVTYYVSDQKKLLSSSKTFIHKTDDWLALVGEDQILNDVPQSMRSLYASK